MSIVTGIRSAVLSDVVSIAKIHVACWQEVYAFMPKELQSKRDYNYRLEQWLKWFDTLPVNEAVYVLTDNTRVVGFAVAKPNTDPDFDVPGEFHACYILPQYRGGHAGPVAMMALAHFLKSNDMWPACIWAFKNNPYRRIYPALGCKPEVFRDRFIAGHALPEIGYQVTDYDRLIARLSGMCGRALERRIRNKVASAVNTPS
ncbi:hypothetical protein IWQ54_000216 [Labrenzia sp. EL_195]|nr:hypothetical protein [Labrenzia sp. EL_195]